MSGIFGGTKKIKVPDSVREVEKKQVEKKRVRGRITNSILSSPLGDVSKANVSRRELKSLLGE